MRLQRSLRSLRRNRLSACCVLEWHGRSGSVDRYITGPQRFFFLKRKGFPIVVYQR